MSHESHILSFSHMVTRSKSKLPIYSWFCQKHQPISEFILRKFRLCWNSQEELGKNSYREQKNQESEKTVKYCQIDFRHHLDKLSQCHLYKLAINPVVHSSVLFLLLLLYSLGINFLKFCKKIKCTLTEKDHMPKIVIWTRLSHLLRIAFSAILFA